jgi:hypothetical protein
MAQDQRAAESRNTDAQGNLVSQGEEQSRQPRESPLIGDDFAHMPYLEVGTDLSPDETYLDLNELDRGPFTPSGSRTVERGDRLVAKGNLDPELWTKLTSER